MDGRMGSGTIYRCCLVCLAALVALGLIGGLSIAVARAALTGGDPNWPRVAPRNASGSPDDRAVQPSIASNGVGRLAIVWRDQLSIGDVQNIYASMSNDDGQTWSTPAAISTTVDNSRLPDVAFTGERAFAVWVDGDSPPSIEMYEAEIGVEGTRTISSPIELDRIQARIAADAERLHVVFSAGASPPQIYHTSRLTDATWPVAQQVYTSAATASSNSPAVAVGPAGETVHIVWEESIFSTGEVLVMYVTGTVQQAAGVAWHSPITLSEVITQAYRPGVVVDSRGVAHFTWGEVGAAGKQEEQYVWYARYLDGIVVRIDPERVRVNDKTPTFVTPDITLHEDEGETTVCITWHGFRPGASNEEEILISCSSDEGASWTGPHNVSQSSGDESVQGLRSIRSSVASDAAGRQHVVWREQSVSGSQVDWEVYHTYGLNNVVYLPLVMRAGGG